MKVLIRMLLVVVCEATIAVTNGPVIAQTLYRVPFASRGNTIELTVENSSSTSLHVTVAGTNLPSWLHIAPCEQSIEQLLPHDSGIVWFTFDLDRSAPVGKEERVTFTVSAPSGEQWTHQIAITIDAPERFELYQNYPNPFNPATEIRYQIPEARHVALKIYDVLGQEVATLVNEVKQPGDYAIEWNAGAIPSGVYFYRLTSGSFTDTKKLILLR